MPRESIAVRAACWCYAVLLRAYPAEFRARFGSELVQVFRARCRAAQAASGLRGLLACALHTLQDFTVSAARERALSVKPASVAALLLAIAFGLFAAFLDFHTDEVVVAVFVILVGTFVVALIRPAGAWRWALASGLCIFLAYRFGPALGFEPRFPAEPGPSATLLALIPAFLGAYSGAFLRWIVRVNRHA